MNDEKEIVSTIEDVETNISVTSQNLVDGESGSDERYNEAKIYEIQHKLHMEMEKSEYQRELEEKKLALEERKLELEEKKEKRENVSLIVNASLVGVEIITFTVTGWATLKYNLEQGGLLGNDGRKWWEYIRHLGTKKF